MLELIIGGLIGLGIGVLGSIVPGITSMQCLWATSFLYLFNPWMGVYAAIVTYAASHSLNSVKEGLNPFSSGNPSVMASASTEVFSLDPVQFIRDLHTSKLVGVLIGTGLAIFAVACGVVTNGTGGAPIAVAVLAFLLIGALSNCGGQPWTVIIYLLLSQVFFAVASWMQIVNPVYAIGLGMYLIPSCFVAWNARPNVGKDVLKTKHTFGAVGSALASVCTPGVSPNAVVSGTVEAATPVTQLNAAIAESIVETFCLYMLCQGAASSKAVLSIELTTAFVLHPVIFVGLLFVVMLGTRYLIPWVYRTYCGQWTKKKSAHRTSVMITLVAGVASTVIIVGPIFGPLLLATGFAVTMLFQRLGIPPTIRSLLFVGKVIF